MESNSKFSVFTPRENIYIAMLDPLGADMMFLHLPKMNLSGDISSIIYNTQTLISNLDIENYTLHQAIASLRDLGIIAGSIKRHGMEPVEVIPGLEAILLKLGYITNMIPRDTLMHYVVWNPEGARKRRYTEHIDEDMLIESAKIALSGLELAIQQLIILYSLSLNSSDFIFSCNICAEHLNKMVEAIVLTIKKVSRQVFSEKLRPYYDSITIQGKNYLGTGAVEMPLFIFDHILWSTDYPERTYVKMKKSLVPYCLPIYRYIYQEFDTKPSLLTKASNELKMGSIRNDVALKSASSLNNLFNILLKFRKPHIKVVNEAYKLAENRSREKGSGGYKEDTLQYLTEITSNAQQKLINDINSCQLTTASF